MTVWGSERLKNRIKENIGVSRMQEWDVGTTEAVVSALVICDVLPQRVQLHK